MSAFLVVVGLLLTLGALGLTTSVVAPYLPAAAEAVGDLARGLWLRWELRHHRAPKRKAYTGLTASVEEADEYVDALHQEQPADWLDPKDVTTMYPAAPAQGGDLGAGSTTAAAGATPADGGDIDIRPRLEALTRYAEQTRLRLALRARPVLDQATRVLHTVERPGPVTQEFRRIVGVEWEQTALLEIGEVKTK